MPPGLVDTALAGPPVRPGTATRSALLIGNVGKLGGELLNLLLESPLYGRVAVAIRKPMRVMVPKLETVVLPVAPGQVFDDLYLCIEPETQSFWKTRKPYVALTSEAAAGIARTLRATGAKRAVVLTPLDAILQMGAVPAIRNTDELAIVSAGYERLLILRPVGGDQASVKPRSVFEAVGSGVVRLLASYMTPSSMQPIRVRQAAQAAIDLLAELGNGVHIVGAEKLRERVGDPLGAKRPY